MVARELTRVHEEYARGTLASLAARFTADPPRGQVTMVVAGASEAASAQPQEGELGAAIRHALASGMTPRDVYRLAMGLKAEI